MIKIIKIMNRFFHYLIRNKNFNLNDNTNYLKECDVLFFCHDADRPISLFGKAYSPLCDSLREDFEKSGLKCISIAHYGSLYTGDKGYGFPISINRKYLIYFVMSKVRMLFKLPRIFKNANIYGYIFDKTKAKLIVTIGAPPKLCMESRKRNLLHVELLHGIGYTYLPWDWDTAPIHFLPNGILSLDYVSTMSFSPLTAHGTKVMTIPNPFLKRFLPGRFKSLPDEWKLSKSISKNYRKTILITMVWGYAGDHGPRIEFANILRNGLFFDEISELVAEEKDIFWRFRFHPVQLRQKKYQKLRTFMDDFVSANPNSEWRESSFLPLPSVAIQCQGNISMVSMSCYDVAAMGVISLMLCPTIQPRGVHENMFTDLVNEGYLTKAKINKEHLRTWVHNAQQLQPRLSNLNEDQAWEFAFDWMLINSGLKSKVDPELSDLR
jgi:hypothetical protein